MMRLHKVPASQFHKEGLICPDGHPFPKDLHLTWSHVIGQLDVPLYGWNKNPFVWVISFNQKVGS